MEKFFNKITRRSVGSNSTSENSPLIQESAKQSTQPPFSNEQPASTNPSSSRRTPIDINALPSDPVDRKPISSYHPNDRDEVRRAYLQKGPYQPRNHAFPQTKMSNYMRRFNESWFAAYLNWLEYSIKKDAAFYLCCYLFKNDKLGHGGGDAFTSKGFRNWKKRKSFDAHVGEVNSVHNQCVKMCEDLMMQKHSIQATLDKQSKEVKSEYRVRLNASIEVARQLLSGILPFRGHDESESLIKRGHFFDLLE